MVVRLGACTLAGRDTSQPELLDPRINRAGRPKLASRLAREGQPLSGKLMSLFVPAKHLRKYLTGRDGPWLKNLPRDFHFAGIGLDRARVGFVVVIGSEEFAAVRAGEPIPEFQGSYWTVEEYTDSLLQKFRSERPGEGQRK